MFSVELPRRFQGAQFRITEKKASRDGEKRSRFLSCPELWQLFVRRRLRLWTAATPVRARERVCTRRLCHAPLSRTQDA